MMGLGFKKQKWGLQDQGHQEKGLNTKKEDYKE